MDLHKSLTTVTPLSKFLAMALFILLPFLGFYLGTQYQELIDFQNIQTMNSNPSAINHPAPSQTQESMENWKTYTGKFFSFKYPEDLYTTSKDDGHVTFYESINEAKERDECVAKKLGTLEKPCGQYMVLNIGVTKYESNYKFALKNSLKSTDPSLIKPIEFTDSQDRIWLIEGPVAIAGAYDLKAEYQTDNFLYNIGIQVGNDGIRRYMNIQSTSPQMSEKHFKLSNQILSTFRFLE